MNAFDLRSGIAGYGLTTANILYCLPDHQLLLQSYTWQDYDLAPVFPKLREFLDFWTKQLDGPLHTVMVAHRQLISPSEVRTVRTELKLN
ncbi:MAG TPA: hypothetical protein VG894_11075 [Bauldia sp.]|nr:hypothetical protein [Bauldia sp.]